MTIRYIPLDDVLAIHDNMISLYGGSYGIRDVGLIESALSRPKATFGGEDLYTSIFNKAAALFHSLMFNHAFIDGNKRTTMAVAARFLAINKVALNASEQEFVAFPIQVEKQHLEVEEIANWFEKNSKTL